MATGTAGTTARDFHTNQVHYWKKTITYTDSSVNVGYVPAGATIVRACAVVTTAFNAGTNNNIDIGNANSGQSAVYASALNGTSVGVKINTTLATAAAAQINVAADTLITAAYTSSGTAATTGSALVVVEYVNL